jgi:hypothetical protein
VLNWDAFAVRVRGRPPAQGDPVSRVAAAVHSDAEAGEDGVPPLHGARHDPLRRAEESCLDWSVPEPDV